MKEKGDVNFDDIFYLTEYIKISLLHVINVTIINVIYIYIFKRFFE